VISLISTLGVTVGVMALIIALAVTTGVQNEMRDRLLGSTAHVYVWKDGAIDDYRAEVKRLAAVEGVLGVGPAIVTVKAMLQSPANTTFINVKGIDPELEPQVTDIETSMQQGSVAALDDPASDLPGIVLGKELAALLMVRVGDQVSLITPRNTLTPGGMIQSARTRLARVAGIFSLGMLEFDSQWAFVTLDFAGRLAGIEGPELFQLRIADPFAAPEVAARVTSELGEAYRAQHWQELNRSLFSALWMEKMVISIAISLIVMVAALQIVASLILMVMEKSRDIGILKTMGTSPRRISLIFMMQGLVIGVIGTTVGAAVALTLCYFANTYKLLSIPMDVYQVSYIPFVVRPIDLAVVIVGAVAICFLATIYPSRQAARLDPVQALRFE
jgi:lipoprotein-releasing system permease protein